MKLISNDITAIYNEKNQTVKTGFKIFNVFPKGVGLEYAVKS